MVEEFCLNKNAHEFKLVLEYLVKNLTSEELARQFLSGGEVLLPLVEFPVKKLKVVLV